MPESARTRMVGTSSLSIDALYSGCLALLKSRIIVNNTPAMRNRNVANATGVKLSFRAILTTTNELPHRLIKVTIRKALKALIGLFGTFRML